jgi:hypothetical protein
MPNYALCGNVQSVPGQLRKTASLDVVDLQNPVLQSHWFSCCHFMFSFDYIYYPWARHIHIRFVKQKFLRRILKTVDFPNTD